MSVVAKRSAMTFFSDGRDHYSHRVRIVLAEKGVTVDVLNVDPQKKPVELVELNPYNELPTLVDREVALCDSVIMMEYLDERFPHPPLLPVYPVERAKSRQLMYRIQRDWCPKVDAIWGGAEKEAVLSKLRKELSDSLVAISPIFAAQPYFMSDEFTLVDCCVAAILWRLSVMEVELPKGKASHLLAYADRLFSRESFVASLSKAERDMRPR